jgi:hypothetical protein
VSEAFTLWRNECQRSRDIVAPPRRWSRPAPSCPPVNRCRFDVSWFT